MHSEETNVLTFEFDLSRVMNVNPNFYHSYQHSQRSLDKQFLLFCSVFHISETVYNRYNWALVNLKTKSALPLPKSEKFDCYKFSRRFENRLLRCSFDSKHFQIVCLHFDNQLKITDESICLRIPSSLILFSCLNFFAFQKGFFIFPSQLMENEPNQTKWMMIVQIKEVSDQVFAKCRFVNLQIKSLNKIYLFTFDKNPGILLSISNYLSLLCLRNPFSLSKTKVIKVTNSNKAFGIILKSASDILVYLVKEISLKLLNRHSGKHSQIFEFDRYQYMSFDSFFELTMEAHSAVRVKIVNLSIFVLMQEKLHLFKRKRGAFQLTSVFEVNDIDLHFDKILFHRFRDTLNIKILNSSKNKNLDMLKPLQSNVKNLFFYKNEFHFTIISETKIYHGEVQIEYDRFTKFVYLAIPLKKKRRRKYSEFLNFSILMNHKGQKYHFEFEDNKQIEWKDLSKYRIDQKKYIVFFLDLNTKAISYQLIESYLTLSIIGRSWSSLFFNSFLNVFQFEEEIKYQKAEISKESQRKTFDWKSPQRILFGVEIKNEPLFENGKFGKIKQTFTKGN